MTPLNDWHNQWRKWRIRRQIEHYVNVIKPERYEVVLYQIQFFLKYAIYYLIMAGIPIYYTASKTGINGVLIGYSVLVVIPIAAFFHRMQKRAYFGGDLAREIKFVELYYGIHDVVFERFLWSRKAEHLPILVDLFETVPETLHQELLEAICHIQNDDAFDFLLNTFLNYSIENTRKYAVRFLGYFRTSDAQDRQLIDLFKSHPDAETRKLLFAHLYRLRFSNYTDMDSSFLLSYMLTEEDSAVRERIALELRDVPDPDPSLGPGLLHFIRTDPSYAVRRQCLFALATIDPPLACQTASDILDNEPDPDVVRKMDVLQILMMC